MAVSRVLRRLLVLSVIVVPLVTARPSGVDASRLSAVASTPNLTRSVHGPIRPRTPHIGGFSTAPERAHLSGLQPRQAGAVIASRTSSGGNFSLQGFPAQFGVVGHNVTDGDYVAMAHTPSGLGAWLVTDGGTVVPVGDAPWLGDASVPGSSLAGGIDIAATPTGLGYWILYADGEIGAYGSAVKIGNVPFDPLDPPVSLAATATGQGLWVLLANGDYFTGGDAQALPETDPPQPVSGTAVAIERSAGGSGYLILLDSSSVLTFGDA